MTDDARAIDPQLIEDLDDSFGVGLRVDAARSRPVAAAVAEEVEHDEPVSGRNERDDFIPQMDSTSEIRG